MQINIETFPYTEHDFYKNALDIRTKVFIEELNVDKHFEYDGLDNEATHYLLIVDGNPCGTARWRETNEGIKLERFAILPKYRSFGFGLLLLKKVLHDVILSKKLIYLYSQLHAVKFYQQFGFKLVGEMFLEAKVQHYKMLYEPSITQNE